MHPDKNKAPGSNNAFQILKKAFDALLSGVDPEDKDTCAINCPDTTNCNAIVYLSSERFKNIMRGSDVGFCKSCKSKFGRVSNFEKKKNRILHKNKHSHDRFFVLIVWQVGQCY